MYYPLPLRRVLENRVSNAGWGRYVRQVLVPHWWGRSPEGRVFFYFLWNVFQRFLSVDDGFQDFIPVHCRVSTLDPPKLLWINLTSTPSPGLRSGVIELVGKWRY